MQIHARQTGDVRGEDVFHHFGIGDGGGTLVVDHEIVAFGVARIGMGGENGGRRFVGGMHVLDDDIGARFEPVLQKIFLRDVIVAATAGEQENLERLGRGGGESDTRQGKCGNEGETAE